MFSLIAQVSELPNIVTTISDPSQSTTFAVPNLVCLAGAGVGACQLAQLFIYMVQQSRLLIGSIGFVIGVIAGFRLIVSQSEEALTTARRTIIGVVVGLFLVFLSEPLVDAMYGGFSIDPGDVLSSDANVQTGVGILSDEVMGVLRWVETLVAIVAVGLIVVQAVSVLGSFGSEERTRKSYRAILYTIVGILLIIFDVTIAQVFGLDISGGPPVDPTTAPLFVEAFGFLRFVLMFVAIIVIGIILYASLLMVFNYGNDEIITRARTTLINAAIGLALIVVSFAIVNTIILGL